MSTPEARAHQAVHDAIAGKGIFTPADLRAIATEAPARYAANATMSDQEREDASAYAAAVIDALDEAGA